MFTVWNSNIKKYIKESPLVPPKIDYILSADIDISKEISILKVNLKDNKKQKNIFSYKYPFRNLNSDELFKVMRENAKNIILGLLNYKEQKRVGVVKLGSIHNDKPIFCENYYLGKGCQDNLIFPAGTADIKIASNIYKIFISPFTINSKMWKTRNFFLLKLKE